MDKELNLKLKIAALLLGLADSIAFGVTVRMFIDRFQAVGLSTPQVYYVPFVFLVASIIGIFIAHWLLFSVINLED
jgi:hypothetical protein